MLSLLWILSIILVVIVVYVIYKYNRFIVLQNRIDNAQGQIDVQLKRRFDLIPNLVSTVKGYAKHEKDTFKLVTEARNLMKGATGMGTKAEANNMLTDALKSIFAVAEAYPDLKANQNFMQLQEELTGTENKISYSRQFYNDSVLKYNNGIEQFPGNIFAKIFSFIEKEMFEAKGAEKEPVKVEF
ncbi:hypothetical protein CMO92_04230 [Candidatus Woesearchaeota archaeon]|nr:hypothetical protein [Candidatus Woesearchaeota archaeon]